MSIKYVASVSFGKDSLAMLLLIIEHKMPLDEVIFYDTGVEFQAIYNIQRKVETMLKDLNIKFTILKPKRPFVDTMYNYEHKSRKGVIKNGYGWCGGLCRWGTAEKVITINKYLKGTNAHQYVGIAFDEKERLKKLSSNKSSPLAELGFTEKMALEYCHNKGFYWLENGVELYSILDRVSCRCCRNKNLKELKNYKESLPIYFEKLKQLEMKIGEPMKKPKYLNERLGK